MNRQDQAEYTLQLHQRLLHGDPVASSEFAEAFLEELVLRLRARAARAGYAADDTLIKDAAVDALLNYFREPTKFDPNRSGLMTYLTMSAHGDLINLLARESRRTRREVPLEDVEHGLSSGNNVVEGLED